MARSNIVIATVVCGTLLSTVAIMSHAGPLDPPSGAVSSTYKTLTEVEPRIAINATNTPGDADATPSLFKITAPGSYYLTANVVVPAGKIGIEIAESPVTIDLGGFVVRGVGASDGISTTVSAGTGALVIRNGSVINCANGVNTNQGNTLIEGVEAASNSGSGIICHNDAIVVRCSTSFGQSGIVVGANCQVLDCNVYQAAGVGITAFSGCTVTNCTARLNTGDGISTGSGCMIAGCAAIQNSGSGIQAGSGSTISACTANSNSSSGLNVAFYCSALDCNTSSNGLDGIVAGQGCLLRGNTCNGNGTDAAGGAGIHVTATDCRLEGNVCNQNDRGIDIDFNGNIVVRNTCAGNTTDWDIVANNVVGPIVDRRAPASPAISGFSFAGSLGTTDANANFSY